MNQNNCTSPPIGSDIYEGDYTGFYDFDGVGPGESEQVLVKGTVTSMECNHNWLPYYGFTESYKFCSKCNAKKE
jgi:hypothetical protein